VTYLLHTYVYSWPPAIGSMVTLLLWNVYCRHKARWLDIHRPLTNGQKHYVAHMNKVWVAGIMGVLVFGYVLLTAQQAQDQAIGVAKDAARCWSEAYKSTKAQIELNAQNDRISREQQNLQREYDRDTSDWLKDLVVPPGGLALQDTNSPARQAYGLQRTAQYQAQIDDLGRQFDDWVTQRKTLDNERTQHPLPETTCGK
jgi:hypothetical protein